MDRVKQGLILNEDDSNFFYTRPAEKMTVEGLHELIDHYAIGQVSHVFLNPNAMRTSYRSGVWDSVWDDGNLEESEDPRRKGLYPWFYNCRLLDQKKIDPYVVWIARCREKGVSPWISMRMNDIHDADDPTSPLHSRFWHKHPEYWRVPGSEEGYFDRAFDYSHKEVREYHLALVGELLERYDGDGLELDWMRFGYHFKPGHEQEGCEILCEFMGQVREMTRQWSSKRGHPIQLAGRVPAHPVDARGLGLDGVGWARRGLVDMLIACPFWESADFDIPMELWRELLGPAGEKITLAAGMELSIRGYTRPSSMIKNTLETMRGFSAAMLDRGADQIYLFNHMDCGTTVDDPEEFRAILEQAGRLETVIDKPRRHIVTYPDTLPPGVAKRQLLPVELGPIRPVQFRIYSGPKPLSGRIILRAGLAVNPHSAQAQFSARVNSRVCRGIEDHAAPEQFGGSCRVVQFEVPPAAMQRGYNLAEIFLNKGRNQQIVWTELYLIPRRDKGRRKALVSRP